MKNFFGQIRLQAFWKFGYLFFAGILFFFVPNSGQALVVNNLGYSSCTNGPAVGNFSNTQTSVSSTGGPFTSVTVGNPPNAFYPDYRLGSYYNGTDQSGSSSVNVQMNNPPPGTSGLTANFACNSPTAGTVYQNCPVSTGSTGSGGGCNLPLDATCNMDIGCSDPPTASAPPCGTAGNPCPVSVYSCFQRTCQMSTSDQFGNAFGPGSTDQCGAPADCYNEVTINIDPVSSPAFTVTQGAGNKTFDITVSFNGGGRQGDLYIWNDLTPYTSAAYSWNGTDPVSGYGNAWVHVNMNGSGGFLQSKVVHFTVDAGSLPLGDNNLNFMVSLFPPWDSTQYCRPGSVCSSGTNRWIRVNPAPSCNTHNFVAGKLQAGHVSNPSGSSATVSPGGDVTVACDFGADPTVGTPSINFPSGVVSCGWPGIKNGTSYVYYCQAPASTVPITCSTSKVSPDNWCPDSGSAGTLNVISSCQAPTNVKINGFSNQATVPPSGGNFNITWDAVTGTSGYHVMVVDTSNYSLPQTVFNNTVNGTALTVAVTSQHSYQISIISMYNNTDSSCGYGPYPVNAGLCTPGATQACGSGSCAGTQTCNSSGTGYSACSTEGNSCNDGNSCTSGDVCTGGSCQPGNVSGSHCDSSNACVPNTVAACTGQSCTNSSECNPGPTPTPTLSGATYSYTVTPNPNPFDFSIAPSSGWGGNMLITNTGSDGITVNVNIPQLVSSGANNHNGSTSYSPVNVNPTNCSLSSGQSCIVNVGGPGDNMEAGDTFVGNAAFTEPNAGNKNVPIQVVVNASNPPTGDIKCNGSDSCTIVSGSSANLTWTSNNATSCKVTPGNYTGTSNLAGQSTGALISNTTYTLNCSGPGAPGGVNVDTVPVTVTAAPDFSITHTPASQTVTQGGSASFTITVNALNGFTGTVDLGTSSCPPASTCTFPSGSQITGGSGSKTLLVATTGPTPLNNYTINVSGTSGALNHTTSPILSVIAGALTCPSGGNTVLLDKSSISIGATANASAPAGFTGGTFSSSNTSVATVSASVVTGASAGSSNITGNNWTYTSGGNSVNNCSLTAAALSVTPSTPGGGAGGGGPSCGQITLTWNAVSGADGYYIYRNTSNTLPAAKHDTKTPGGSGTISYTDTAPSGVYYYWISSFKGTLESAPVAIASNSSGGLGSSSCDASLGSEKDIVKINGSAPAGYNPGNDGQSQAPVGYIYTQKDIVSFAIHLSYNPTMAGSASADNIVIADRLTNLKQPTAGFNLKVSGAAWQQDNSINCSTETTAISTLKSNRYGVCGSAPNQTLYIKIPSLDLSQTTASITYDAEVSAPAGYSASSSRFQNRADIYFDKNSTTRGKVSVSSPILLFNVSNVPTKIEIPGSN